MSGMLVFLVISSISEVQPVSREAAKELDGRIIDGELIEELKPAMKVENGSTVIEINAEYWSFCILNSLYNIFSSSEKDEYRS